MPKHAHYFKHKNIFKIQKDRKYRKKECRAVILLCWGGIDFFLQFHMHYEYVSHAYIWNRHYHSLASFVAEFFFFLKNNNVTVNVRVFHFLLLFCYMSNVIIVNWFLNVNLPFLLRWTYKGIGLNHKRNTIIKGEQIKYRFSWFFLM